jgi:hypothetical protein
MKRLGRLADQVASRRQTPRRDSGSPPQMQGKSAGLHCRTRSSPPSPGAPAARSRTSYSQLSLAREASWETKCPALGDRRPGSSPAALIPSPPRSVGHAARARRETPSPIAARDSAARADLHAVHEVRFGAVTARQLNRVSHEESGMLAVHVQAEPMRCGDRVELTDDGRRAPCNQCRIGSNLVESVERLGDYSAACLGAFQVLMLSFSRKHRAIDEETVPLLYCAHAPQHRSEGTNAQPQPRRGHLVRRFN